MDRRGHPTTVYIAEDHPIYRTAVEQIVRRSGFELLGSSDDGREALSSIRDLAPHIALIDLDLPSMNGQTIIEAIVTLGLPTRALILSGTSDEDSVQEAIQRGAAGYLAKTVDPAEIKIAIVTIARGDIYVAPDLTRPLIPRVRQPPEVVFTARELQVLTLMASGRSLADIAKDLVLGVSTIKTHATHVYAKLGVRNQGEAIAIAVRKGYIK